MTDAPDRFPTSTDGLPAAGDVELVELADGATFDLRIAPVAKRLGDATVRMLAYNGSIPGPTLRVREGAEVVVELENQGDVEATVHWHGLRLENRYDGTHETQAPVTVGGRYSARVRFPDPGVYWYHPHIVVRFHLTNTANTRVFMVVLPGAPMKLVGGDSGRVEREEIVDHVVLAPSERAIVDVLFDGPRTLALEHHTPDRVHRLASIEVAGDPAEPPLTDRFSDLRTNADMVAERQRIAPYVEAEPDKVVSFLAEMAEPANWWAPAPLRRLHRRFGISEAEASAD